MTLLRALNQADDAIVEKFFALKKKNRQERQPGNRIIAPERFVLRVKRRCAAVVMPGFYDDSADNTCRKAASKLSLSAPLTRS